MELFKKKSVALLIMIAVMVFSTLVQGRADMLQTVKKTENLFLIDEGDGFSIQSRLDSKMEFANELANKFAVRFLKMDDDAIVMVEKALEYLQDADTIQDKYKANQQLDQACNQLMGLLEKERLDEDNKRELRRFYTNLQNCQDQISHSLYNEKALKAQEELSRFPASLIQGIFRIEMPQLFQ